MKKLILIAALAASPAYAQFYSGNDLLEKLNDTNPAQRMFALGYVAAVIDTVIDVQVCPPDQIQVGQVRDIVHRWLQNNPDKRQFTASSIVIHALKQSWPCKTQPSLAPGGKS